MDHKPLLTIFGLKKGLPTHTANRLQRWGVILLNYDFRMEFLPSQKLGHVVRLSRLIPKMREPLEDTVISSLPTESIKSTVLCDTVKELPVTLEEIRKEAAKEDVKCSYYSESIRWFVTCHELNMGSSYDKL